MLSFSGIIQNIIFFGVSPNTLPLVMYIMIICHWAILPLSFKTIAGRSLMVFSDDFLHFLKTKKTFVEFTKTILWL